MRNDHERQEIRNHYIGHARQRGSVILLVVAALVLSMLLGLAYVSTARQDRRSTRTASVAKDIEQVERSVINQIQDVLREDVGYEQQYGTDASGDPIDWPSFFQERDIASGNRAPFKQLLRPPLDYPGLSVDEESGTAYAPSPWLSSTAPLYYQNVYLYETTPDSPDRDTPTVIWPQITRLTESYVQPDGTVPGTPDEEQHSLQVATVNPNDPDYLSLGYQADGETGWADADGDGILDSRWERSPLYSLNGIDYYMAVRIEDNSARLNANVAFSQLNNSGQYQTNEAQSPRWAYPTELDLGSLAFRYGSIGGDGSWFLQNEVEPFLEEQRLDASLGHNWPIYPEQMNLDYWQEYYGNVRTSDRPQVAMDSEFSLRYRGGLNNRDLESQMEGEDNGMPWLLRHYPENQYDPDGPYYEELTFWDAVANMETDGATDPYPSRTTLGGDAESIAAFFEINPRGHLTTVSGASERYTPHGTQWDLKTLLEGDIDLIAGAVMDAWSGDDLAIPPGFNAGTIADPMEQLRAFAFQYTVNLRAFAQGFDGQMPRIERDIDGAPMRFYGHVPLPFVAEVYSQRKYIVTDRNDTMMPFSAEWTAEGEAGYAIEIRNPYQRRVRMDNTYLRVGGENWGQLDLLAGQVWLEPDDVLILWRPSDAPLDGTEQRDDVSEIIGTVDGNLIDVEIDEVWPNGGGEVEVELLCGVWDVGPVAGATPETETLTIDDGAGGTTDIEALPYQLVDYIRAHEEQMIVDYSDAGSLPQEGDISWDQQASSGVADGLNLITIMGSDFVVEENEIREGQPVEHVADLGTLGEVVKLGAGQIGVDIGTQQVVFPDRPAIEGLHNVGEMLLVTVLAPGRGASVEERTFAGQWASSGATRIEDFMFDVGQTHLGDTATWSDGSVANLHSDGVPYPYVLMSRFTVRRHHDDGDRPNEGQFSPGTININSATRELLLSALAVPFDNPGATDRTVREETRRDVVDAILRYRDNLDVDARPNTGAPQWRRGPGIRHIGEIYAATWHLFGDTGQDEYDIANTPIDRLGNPDANTPDGIADDMEEKTLVLRMLSQMLTTRSDVFTAHILIRGYPYGNTTEPLVERRLIGVFDRSEVLRTNGQGTPRLLGLYRY